MNSRIARLVIGASVISAVVMTALGQNRPYDQIMNVAAKDNNGQKAQAAYNAIGKSCKGCHDSHRESMPDKSFRIKP